MLRVNFLYDEQLVRKLVKFALSIRWGMVGVILYRYEPKLNLLHNYQGRPQRHNLIEIHALVSNMGRANRHDLTTVY